MEIFRLGKRLADEARSDNVAVHLTRLPFACFGKINSERPVITAGYKQTGENVKTSVNRNPGPSSLNMTYSFFPNLREMQRDKHSCQSAKCRETAR